MRGDENVVKYGGAIEREEPVGRSTREADVIVPLLQAMITGVMVGLIGGGIVLTIVILWGDRWGLPWWIVPLTGVGLWIITAAWVWWDTITWNRDLLWKIERMTGTDLNLDGKIGNPQPEPEVRKEIVRLEMIQPEPVGRGPGTFYRDLPIAPEMFTLWARAALNDQSLAVGAWVGEGAPFERSDYDDLMATLHQSGVVEWVKPGVPTLGRRLTRIGKAALRVWLRQIDADRGRS